MVDGVEAPRRVDRDLVRVMVRVSAHEENNTSVEWPRRLQRASGCAFLCLSACLPIYLPMRMKMALLYLLGYSRYAYLGVRTNMALLALLRLLRVQSAELWLYSPYYGCTTAVLRLYYGGSSCAPRRARARRRRRWRRWRRPQRSGSARPAAGSPG